jgi:hypothetical protein
MDWLVSSREMSGWRMGVAGYNGAKLERKMVR